MDGYILTADGTRLDGELAGPARPVIGRLVANTSVVGFQQMATDPAYAGTILAFTYPEVGNVGATAAFSESKAVQVAGLVVRVLAEHRSHYLSEEDLLDLLARDGVPCLTGIDTRWLAVEAREKGEMAAAIAPAEADAGELREALQSVESPEFRPTEASLAEEEGSGPVVAVLNLGIRRSQLRQLSLCCRPRVFAHDAGAADIMGCRPAAVYVSDGPGTARPPEQAVATIGEVLGRAPVLACGLGHVALGQALGCEPAFLRRGHHGANCPVRNLEDGTMAVTAQRHSVMLDRDSVEACDGAEVAWENLNDATVEGIRSPDGSAVGYQFMLAASRPGVVNGHISRFVDGLAGSAG